MMCFANFRLVAKVPMHSPLLLLSFYAMNKRLRSTSCTYVNYLFKFFCNQQFNIFECASYLKNIDCEVMAVGNDKFGIKSDKWAVLGDL